MTRRLRLALLATLFGIPGFGVRGSEFGAGSTHASSQHPIHPLRGYPNTQYPIPNLRETHRIRIGNRKGGAIEISLDGGQNWVTVGRVTQPATDTGAGFTALAAAPPGSIAAISVEGLTVRSAPGGHPAPAHQGETAKPRIFRLLPAGRPASAAGIGTDVAAGHGIFGPLAPPLGSKLLLETATGAAQPLPGGYIPQVGDHLIIVATVPADAPAMLVFENKTGGRVLSVSPTGDETVVGQVRRPLRGVERYPATEGAECGSVVSHFPAAIVVASTSAKPGELGGFLIQPVSAFRRSGVQAFGADKHSPAVDASVPERLNARTPERLNAGESEDGSVLVVDHLALSGPAFGVPITLSPAGGSLVGETRVEARLDGGPWEPLPAAVGSTPAAFTGEALTQQFAALGTPRHLAEGVTHLRLILAPPSPERLRAALARAAVAGSAALAAAPDRPPPARPAIRSAAAHPEARPIGSRKGAPVKGARKGTLRIVANIQGRGIVYVMFYVDGHIRKLTNTPPFEWLWDTRGTPNGIHSLEIRGADADGRILTTQKEQLAISN
jgi:hypothetical protein